VNPASLAELPAVLEWAERTAPGARVAGYAVRPLAGGAVARRVDQVTLHLTGHHEPLELVWKQASAHEIAGLRAAQAARQEAAAIPELVAWGSDCTQTNVMDGGRRAGTRRARSAQRGSRTWIPMAMVSHDGCIGAGVFSSRAVGFGGVGQAERLA
jgi:hypothetical protein